MKTITVVIPTFNEELNVVKAYERVKHVFEEQLKNYEFQILVLCQDLVQIKMGDFSS